MPLNLTNLHFIIQGKVDALGPTADEKTLLLLSKAIEAAVGNVAVSELIAQSASGVQSIEAARVAQVGAVNQAGATQVGAVNQAGAAQLAAIQGIDAVKKSGDVMTGPLRLAAGTAAAPSVQIGETSSGFYWVAAGVLALVSAGVEVFRTAATGVLTFVKAVVPKTVPLPWASTITIDLTQGNKFSVTLGGATTFGNPVLTAAMVGQEFTIIPTQDGAGNRTVACGGFFRFPNGAAPTASTTAGKRDRIVCEVVSITAIDAVYIKGF